MRFAIIASRKDEAGMNISRNLEKLGIKVNYVDKEIIYAENIDKERDADFIIFASKHQGRNARTLSIHAPGNWRNAELGGQQGRVCMTSALMLKHFFKILDRNKKDWNITLECTHHGPYIEKPCLFIEIGSNKDDWKDEEAGEIIAKTIKEAILTNAKNYKAAVGIGGPHYCPNFNKIQLSSEIAISHIIPEYSLPLTREILEEAISKTQEKVELAILDWKGIGNSNSRQEIIRLLKEAGLDWKKTSDIEK